MNAANVGLGPMATAIASPEYDVLAGKPTWLSRLTVCWFFENIQTTVLLYFNSVEICLYAFSADGKYAIFAASAGSRNSMTHPNYDHRFGH